MDPEQTTSTAPGEHAATATRLALASRGDALTDPLFGALQHRFPIVGRIDPELTRVQRYEIAALTFRPNRSRWVERFYKSGAARVLRSRNAARQFRAMDERPDAVFQVHALFDLAAAPTVIYIDCTHHQSAEFWPAWNPLRGRALERWYRHERQTYSAAKHLFAFSEWTRDSLIQDYDIAPDRVTVVGAGVNFPELPAPDAVVRRPPDGPPTVLFIGNDFVRKGGLVLLEAFRAVRAAISDARLQLVGTDAPIRPEPGVEILGRIHDRDRIADLYANASVFAVPSFFDPFPLVLLEAMAFGVPAVSTVQAGTPEMMVDGSTGRLVEPGDAGQLADALLQLLTERELAARFADAARRDVAQRFTWDAVVDRMAPALHRLSPGLPR